jgi:RimJ/RimL family protein N-acetyltransferase
VGVIEPRVVRGRAGIDFTLRCAVPTDAGAIIALRLEVASTSEEVLTQADEIPTDPAEQRGSIQKAAERAGDLLIVAECAGRIVGNLDLKSGARRRAAHTCELGIGIARDWRGRGVGNALFEAAMEWAASHPRVEKVHLGVFPTNAAGLALYRKFGFVEEAHRPRHGRHDDGRYVDLILMARWVKGPPA